MTQITQTLINALDNMNWIQSHEGTIAICETREQFSQALPQMTGTLYFMNENIEALIEIGYISKSVYQNPQEINVTRYMVTDAGYKYL